MEENKLEYSVEGKTTSHMSILQDVQKRLKKGIHIGSEIIDEAEGSMGVFEYDGCPLGEYTLDQLEETGRKIVDYLRRFDGVFDVDYELSSEYPLEIIVMFE